MIKNKEFKKLCNLSKTILQKRPNISNLGNPFLFLVSGHPFFLSRYKHITSKKINFLFYLNYILKINFNLVKIFFYTFKIFLTKNKNNINKKKNYQFIILSHIINKKNFYKKIDSQFGGIEKKFPPKKTIFFYLDHIKLSQIDLERKINNNHNFYLNNDCVDFKIYYKIIKNIFFEFSFFLKKSLKTKKNFDKKFYLACSQYLLSLSTVKNISLFYNIEKFILENNVKTIVTTLEGHPYEFLVFFLKKIHDVKVYAYQHSLVTNSHFSMFLDIDKDLTYSKLFTNGEISFNFLKTKIKSDKVSILGSNKYKKRKKLNLQNPSTCLILPTGLENESKDLLNLCSECLKYKKNKINFILRLHPHINKDEFIKKNKKLLANIKISNSTKLEKDISLSKFVLYRGSSSVIEAMQQGLIPIYFHDDKNTFQIDPLWQLKSRIIVNNSYQLYLILKKNNSFKKDIINKNIKFSNKFYTPIDRKKLNEVIKI